jgi:hypothetical protein
MNIEHVGSKISAKIKIYILTRAELLITLCNEIPCTSIQPQKIGCRVFVFGQDCSSQRLQFYVAMSKDLWRNGRNTPWTCNFWKCIVGGGSYYTPGLDGGWFFGPWAVIILKSSYKDLSNEGSKMFWVHWNLFFKLLKHGHFWINFRFWLVWVDLRNSKALSSLNFLQRHGKYQIGSCPQLLYA